MTNVVRSLGAAVIIVVGPDRKIPIVRESNHPDGPLWKFPGGHAEVSEYPADCAIRELREETGLKIDTVQLLSYLTKFSATEREHVLGVYYRHIPSWEGLAEIGSEGEEIRLATAREIFLMSDFVRDHHIYLKNALKILPRNIFYPL